MRWWIDSSAVMETYNFTDIVLDWKDITNKLPRETNPMFIFLHR